MSFNTKNTHKRKKEAVILNLNTSFKKKLQSWQLTEVMAEEQKIIFIFHSKQKLAPAVQSTWKPENAAPLTSQQAIWPPVSPPLDNFTHYSTH